MWVFGEHDRQEAKTPPKNLVVSKKKLIFAAKN